MVQELLPFLPPGLTSTQAALCVALMAAGALLWALGAVWSRGIVTLIAVALGGILGELLPRWQHWPLNSMAASVLGAVLLGTFAFITPRLWVGLMLGTILCAWTVLAAWMLCRSDQNWTWRQDWEVQSMTFPQHAQDMWERTPEPVRRVLPYGAGTAMMSGLAMSVLFPRLSRALCASAGGVTIFFASALTMIASRRPDWLPQAPTRVDVQAGLLVGITLVGVVVQWMLLPSRRAMPAGREQMNETQASGNVEQFVAPRRFV